MRCRPSREEPSNVHVALGDLAKTAKEKASVILLAWYIVIETLMTIRYLWIFVNVLIIEMNNSGASACGRECLIIIEAINILIILLDYMGE